MSHNPGMNTKSFAFLALAGAALNLGAGETLRLKLEPDRKYVVADSPQEVVVKIDLSGIRDRLPVRRTPLNLAVVLDRSGSMAGAKIEKARQGALEALNRLGPGDYFSLISYSDNAEVVICSQQVEDKDGIRDQISRIRAGGSTALYAGVQAGADQVRKHLTSTRVNRVVLLSDGLANVGPSSTRQLRDLGRRLSEEGVSVTTIGVGDDYNEDLMAGLAEASDANYYYVKDTEKLPGIFGRELGELQAICARDVRIEIVCPEGVRPIELIGRPERFEGRKARLSLSSLSAGQERSLFLRCRVENPGEEVARAQVVYFDALNGGVERSVTEVAQVRVTRDPKLAAKSVSGDVVAATELLTTALAKDQALADADAGRLQEAALNLQKQADVLDQRQSAASAPMQQQLRLEIDNLRSRAAELQRNEYAPGTRKALQNEAWSLKNAK
jgi:Ca-activated chloride channel family protein